VLVGLDSSFVARGIKFPCGIYILVEVGISPTKQEGVCLSLGKVNNLPRRFGKEVDSRNSWPWRCRFSVVIIPLLNSLQIS